MTFKAAICPSCGGALQVPENSPDVKCLYCGVDVFVREDTQSAAGRVEELTTGARSKTPHSISRLAKVLIGCGALALLPGIILLGQADYASYGGLVMVIALVLIMIGAANL